MINCSFYKSPIGYIKIKAENEYITEVSFVKENIDIKGDKKCSRVIEKCKNQLEEYFLGERNTFDLKIKFLRGTDFQMRVWNELKYIPYGETVSYKYIAEKINNPNAVRAVGGANNKTPISIIIPCHRVIGANGKMVGYAEGIDKKEFLLNLEKNNKR